MRAWKHILLLLVAAFLMESCKRPVLYSYQPVNPAGWHSTDTLCFELSDVPAGVYTFSVGVRATHRMPYAELLLVLEQRRQGNRRHRDTVRLNLQRGEPFQSHDGQPLMAVEQPVLSSHLSAHEMPVELLVYHVMRHQSLTGMMDVGVRVQAVQ